MKVSLKIQWLNTEKEPLIVLNVEIIAVLKTREQTLVTDEYIRIRERLKNFCTPHVIRSTMVSRVC